MSSLSRPDRHRTPSFTRATHLGASKCDLERDSGFSDASSEHLSAVDLTDSEDARRNGSAVGLDPIGPQVAVMGGSYAGLSPMIIMNNFVLKQPSTMAPAENQWGFPSPLEVMPQSQMVLLQTMVSNSSSGSSNAGSESVRQSKSYMPIKSYPKIAPQPSDKPAKRAGSSKVRVSSTSGCDQRQKRHHGHRPYGSQTTIKSISSLEAANNQSQAAESQDSDTSLSELAGGNSPPPYADEFGTDLDSSRMDADQDDALSMDVNKLKRFSNTYNILNKSGLLGITMRTKQLIKENKRTQGQLQQLQEQTVLLLEAQSSGDPRLWTKLQLSLQRTDKEQCGAKAQRVPV